MQLSLEELSRKPSLNTVHAIDCSLQDIPLIVQNLLGHNLKFISALAIAITIHTYNIQFEVNLNHGMPGIVNQMWTLYDQQSVGISVCFHNYGDNKYWQLVGRMMTIFRISME